MAFSQDNMISKYKEDNNECHLTSTGMAVLYPKEEEMVSER